MNKLSCYAKAEIITAHNSGVKTKTIADQYGISVQQVRRIIKSYNNSNTSILEQEITPVLHLVGDVDKDGKVSIMDATIIQRHIAQLTSISEERIVCADTDKDGKISIVDATMIQRFIAQLISQL